MVDARISGEVRRVIHRRYHIHVYRFESCPDYKRVSYSKKTSKTGVLKDMWVRVPQRRQLPMAELVNALVIKTETRIWFGSSVVEQVWLTPDFVTGGFDSTPDHNTRFQPRP